MRTERFLRSRRTRSDEKMKLTTPQITALRRTEAEPLDVTYWGGRPMAGLPGFTDATLRALVKRGLLETCRLKGRPYVTRYKITEDGIDALKDLV